jgi:hypothetical protein
MIILILTFEIYELEYFPFLSFDLFENCLKNEVVLVQNYPIVYFLEIPRCIFYYYKGSIEKCLDVKLLLFSSSSSGYIIGLDEL